MPRWAGVAAVAGLHVLFLLAPPLLSQDVFSYIAYARIGVEHGLDPYATPPLDIAGDPVFGFAGSKDAPSVYGPLFTLLTYPLVPLGVAGAFWALKVVAAVASLGVVALVWRGAERRGRDPLPPALLVGLNPHVLVHVVAGAHNEAPLALATMAGVLVFLGGRERAGTAVAAAAAGIKASAALVVPFLALGARRKRPQAVRGHGGEPAGTGAGRSATLDRAVERDVAGGLRRAAGAALAAAAVGAGIALVGLAAFGAEALDAFGLIGSNQGRTSRFSLPHKTAELLAAVLPGDRLDYRTAVRAAYALGFAAALGWLLLRTWRGADPVRMAGWATLAVLLASAWLVPWYLMWLLPLAALAFDRRLVAATIALSAWALAIAVPL